MSRCRQPAPETRRSRIRGDNDGTQSARLPAGSRRRLDPGRRRDRSDHPGRRALLGGPPADHAEPAQGLPGLVALRYFGQGPRPPGQGARHHAAARRPRAVRPHVHACARRLEARSRRPVQGSEAPRRRRRHHQAPDPDPFGRRRGPLPRLGRHDHPRSRDRRTQRGDHPGARGAEVPFGEFTGYSKGAEGPAPVFEVTGITRRRDAIYRHMQATVFTDHQPLVSVPMEASLYRRLSEIHGRTEIHDVYIPPWVTMFTVFVQMTPRWDGQARDVLLGVLSSPYLHPKIAIAVDEDVNIYDPRELFWAISTRVNPERDVIMIPHERIHPLDISAPNVDRSEVTVMRVGGKMAIDATKPPLWRKKERDEFARIKPKGADDPALQALLARLASMG